MNSSEAMATGKHRADIITMDEIVGASLGSKVKEVCYGTQKVHTLPACTACPEVEITEQGVTIGEDENTVRLSHAEWNELVRLVKSRELREV
jgi:hypothetical protein